MENGAFTVEPADSPKPVGTPSPPLGAAQIEMKTHSPVEEKQPLRSCGPQCACVEIAARPAGTKPNVQVKSWNRVKTAVLVGGVTALLVWCGVMATMYHYGVL